jgi:hypothetical protein
MIYKKDDDDECALALCVSQFFVEKPMIYRNDNKQ